MYEHKGLFIPGGKPKVNPEKVKELEKMLDQVEKLVTENQLFDTLKQFNDKFKNKS